MSSKHKSGCKHEKGPYACNRLTCNVCAYHSACMGYLPNIRPKFDQLFISIRAKGKVYTLFKEKFGKPAGKVVEPGITYWRFANGIFLSTRNEHLYYTVRLEATDVRLLELWEVLKELQPTNSKRPAFMLQSAELAWDFPFKGAPYKKVECLLHQLAKLFIPKNSKARLRYKTGKKQRTHDGAINGECTYYFQRHTKDADGRLVPLPTPSWHVKIYPKQIDKCWNIRFEVTLKRDSLLKRITKTVPTYSTPSAEHVATQLTEYGLLSEFKWNDFADVAGKLARAKGIKRMLTVQTLLHAHRNNIASRQRRVALYVAALAHSDWLKRRIGRGDFYRPVKLLLE